MKKACKNLVVRRRLFVSLMLLTVGLLANIPAFPNQVTESFLYNQVAAFWPSQNTVTGNFSSNHVISFGVLGWPEQTQLEIKVWYFMWVVETYKIWVQYSTHSAPRLLRGF